MMTDQDKIKLYPALVNELQLAISLLVQIGGDSVDSASEMWSRLGKMKVVLDEAMGLKPVTMDRGNTQYKEEHGEYIHKLAELVP